MADLPPPWAEALKGEMDYAIGRQETAIRTLDDVHRIVSGLAEPPEGSELGDLLKALVAIVQASEERGRRMEAMLEQLLQRR